MMFKSVLFDDLECLDSEEVKDYGVPLFLFCQLGDCLLLTTKQIGYPLLHA